MIFWGVAAWAIGPLDGLPPLASALFASGNELAEEGDYRGAARRYRKVLELDPEYSGAGCRLGSMLAAQQRREDAETEWARWPNAALCVESLGRAKLSTDPQAALLLFQRLDVLTSSEPYVLLLQAQALSELDLGRAQDAIHRYLSRTDEPSSELLPAVLDVADRLPPADALAFLHRIESKRPDLEQGLAALQFQLTVDLQTDRLLEASAVSLSVDQRARLTRAREVYVAGELKAALAQLETLADGAARSPDVWSALADVREAQGDLRGAESALQLARLLEPMNPSHHVRLADFLVANFAHRYDDEAYTAVERALELTAAPEVRWRHAKLALETRRWRAAEASLASLSSTGPHQDEARRLLADLQRSRAKPPALPAVPRPHGISEEAWRGLHRAMALWERARKPGGFDPEIMELALQELTQVEEEHPPLPRALNLRARILTAQGDRRQAVEVFRQSLLLDPEQPEVLAASAELQAARGDEQQATELWRRAANEGSGTALYRLAVQATEASRWWTARALLQRYFTLHSSGPMHKLAIALSEEVEHQIFLIQGAGGVAGALVFGLLVIPIWIGWRRRSGVGVKELLARAPRSYREVSRILSSIRHEILKHNIAALPAVADALEANDLAVAAWWDERVFGVNGASSRFQRYIEELEMIARREEVPLNLSFRDPVFRPLLDQFARLRVLRRRLGSRDAPALREISAVLNQQCSRALGRLVREACRVSLSEEVFRKAWSDVCAESGATPRSFPHVQIACNGGVVRIDRGDLHDVLVNLMRNALEASTQEGADRIGVFVCRDEDAITGLLRYEIRICDDVERPLTTAMIRGRFIDRGLGLAVDLTSRAGGSIHVEPQAGWSKAVVIRLPAEEE